MTAKKLLAQTLRKILPVDKVEPFQHGELIAAVFLDSLSSTQWENRNESAAWETGPVRVMEVGVDVLDDGGWNLTVYIAAASDLSHMHPISLTDLLTEFEPMESIHFQLLN